MKCLPSCCYKIREKRKIHGNMGIQKVPPFMVLIGVEKCHRPVMGFFRRVRRQKILTDADVVAPQRCLTT